MRRRRQRAGGFTLIELLVALAIFSLATAMAAASFFSVTKAWSRGGELLEQLHYGEFAMEQLVTALRGAAWFGSKPEAFGFWLESDKASWVTSGTAFLPPDSPLVNGLHRLSVEVGSVGGERGLVVRAWPHLAEELDENDAEPWLVAPGVEEFACEWYDFDADDWSQDWEETNSLPKLVRVTLTMEKRENFDENLELRRVVVLEVAPEIPGREGRDRSTAPAENTDAAAAAATNATAAAEGQTQVDEDDEGEAAINSGKPGGGR